MSTVVCLLTTGQYTHTFLLYIFPNPYSVSMEATGSVVPPSTSPYITFPFVPFMSVNSSAAAPSSAMPSMSPSGSSVSTPLFCCVLSLLTLLGVTGNLYTLVLLVRRRRTKRRRGGGGTGSGGGGVTCCSLSLPVPSCLANKSSFSSSPVSSSPPHASSSSYLHMQVLSLALADLLYLLTAPFIVADSLGSGWAFGELGCRLLLSLDLLTMHASIFTLTAMSLDRYRAVADPLHATAASRRSGLLRIGLAWGLAVALSLPMMITLHLLVDRQGTLCVPAWDEQSSKVYLSVLFCTSILGPGLAIGALYATLGRLYWVSQTRPAWARGPGSSTAHPPRAPRPKVLLLILGIVLAFWACFLPFWVWQLLPLYRPDMLRTLPVSTQVTVNRVLTCLTYGNSCVNPFFYTLLTGNNRRRRSNNNNNRQQTPVSSANLLCRKSSPPQ